MSIPMAPSSEIFIDDISKKSLIFKEKGLDLIGRCYDDKPMYIINPITVDDTSDYISDKNYLLRQINF